jgi:hypothetical protein
MADKRTLIRRATFDLTGLPPTPKEVEGFEADRSPDAFAKVVERLLASPRYGERWGRHWLDVARYADSNGMDENLAYASAWRYRDYVVAAFNADKPYDQFIREQLAGDLLPRTGTLTDYERVIATGFLTIGPKMLAEDDPVKMEMDIIDEQLDTASRAFMGLTVGCARCHDHKYDPVPAADYYAMAGIFKSTHTMDNFKVVARWQERPLGNPEEIERLASHRKRIDEQQRRVNTLVSEGNAQLLRQARARAAEYLLAATEQRELDQRTQGTNRNTPSTLTNAALVPEFMKQWAAYLEKTEKDTNSALSVWHGWIASKQTRAPGAKNGSFPLIPALSLGEREKGILSSIQSHASVGSSRPSSRVEKAEKPPGATDPQSTAGPDSLSPGERAGVRGNRASDSPIALALFRDAPSRSLAELAARYSEQFSQADLAWQRLKSSTNGAKADKLSDPVQESFRAILYAPKGPFELPKNAEGYFATNQVAALTEARATLKSLEESLPALPEAMAVSDGAVQDLRVHLRGSHLSLGERSPRGFLASIRAPTGPAISTNGSGRLQFAKWLADPEHPLTARVMVNRIWHGHFGEGLVRSTDNFGTLGERPTHPELLDWLARRFIESGWSVKAMHRLIMNSAVYQQASRYSVTSNQYSLIRGGDSASRFGKSAATDHWLLNADYSTDLSHALTRAATIDPENRLLSYFPRRRLEAEAIRDFILFVSGGLDLKMGGSLLTVSNRAYVTSTASKLDGALFNQPRRSVYLPVIRSALYNVFQIFDFADPSTLNGHRDQTTVAPQALFMMNSKLVAGAAQRLVEILAGQNPLDGSTRVETLYRLALSRPPTEAERTAALKYAERYAAKLAERNVGAEASRLNAWQSLARTVLASNEFIYVE